MSWYTGNSTYDTVLLISFIYVALVVVVALFVQAPYGRFSSDKYGVSLSPRLGWFLMELPATLSFVYFYFQGENWREIVPLIFLAVWLIHYGNRGFIFPFLIRAAKGSKGSFSITIILSGWLMTVMHGYLNATFISELGKHYTIDWLSSPQFIIGIVIYYFGFIMNIHSDAIVRNLRTREEAEAGSKVYRIPEGGLFKYVSNPSYLTELIAWTGFAIATWSLGAVFVLAISAANLIPRAFQTHRWYLEKFDNYPKDRKVIVPFLL
jgi:3-oxo-5-alpha-steroid 4-dehydrogenase 1